MGELGTSSTERLIKDLQSVAAAPPEDPEVRKRLYDAARRFAVEVESPMDTIYRVIYAPKLLTIVETASRMELFETLCAKNGDGCTISELAKVKGANEVLTARILRWLASHDMVDQIDRDTFKANHITNRLNDPGFRGGVKFFFDGTMRCLQEMPDFLESTNFDNPHELLNNPSHRAFKTKLPRFEYINEHQPQLAEYFGRWMTAQHNPDQNCFDVIDISKYAKDCAADQPLFVDVGGGVGNQSASFKEKLPDAPGKVILQDHATVLENAVQTEGVESMEFDFWEEQPIKNARIYYFRFIFHDYPDTRCLQLLKNTIPAMSKSAESPSYIMIDDMIVPEVGANPHATDKDVSMMVNFAAMERTERQWDNLFKQAGLRRVDRGTYNPIFQESIQVLELDR